MTVNRFRMPNRGPRAGIRTPFTRRSLLRGAAVMGAAAALPGLRHAQAQETEGVLNMMGWADYINPDNIVKWEELTGSTMIYDSYASNDEMYSKLQLAGGNSGYDLGMNTDFMMRLLIEGGYIEKIDHSQIPNIANIRPEFASPAFDPGNEYTVPKSWGSQGFIYDKSAVSGPMTSWTDFLRAMREEASGQVAVLDDALAVAPFFWSRGESWNSTDETLIAEVEKDVAEYGKHVRTFNSYAVQDVATGTVVLAQIWNGNAKQAIESSGNENLVFVYPEPKSEAWFDSYHMPIGGEHPNAAHSWMNFVLDSQVAADETAYTGFLSPVSGIEEFLPAGVADNPLIFPPADAMGRGEQTLRNETYDRRVGILNMYKAAAAQ
ncbi:MAG: spermidine/putrescine ABC transporter substrate-binding protein [Dongiaceae bacterium]